MLLQDSISVCVSAIDVWRERKTGPADIYKLFFFNTFKRLRATLTLLFLQLSVAASATRDNAIK